MKYLYILLVASLLLVPVSVNSQEDTLLKSCADQLKSPFVMTGQPLKAFLTGDEVAEFYATLYDGNIYRLVACSHDPNDVSFTVYDKDRNPLFSSRDYVDANFWDFKMEGSIECIIEVKLNTQRTSSGIALLMMGFKNVQN
jgi:hypothetical protein